MRKHKIGMYVGDHCGYTIKIGDMRRGVIGDLTLGRSYTGKPLWTELFIKSSGPQDDTRVVMCMGEQEVGNATLGELVAWLQTRTNN